MQRFSSILLISLVFLLASAFAGSGDAYFAGTAGPYDLRVVVHTPGVIPGLAAITVAVANPEEIRRVAVQPIFWNIPPERAPAPDIARPAQGGEFHANLWLMVAGSYGVRVSLQGTRGAGTVIVPVTAVAYQRLDMSRGLELLLLALGAFLASGLITIVGSAARESTLPAGSPVQLKDRRRGWIGVAGGALVVIAAMVGGRGWWSRMDQAYHHRLYQPPRTQAEVVLDPAMALRISVRDSAWVALRHDTRPLIQDGRKLAHMFLVGDNAFAHLHPTRADSAGWEAALPSLPPGSYRVFTEVVDSSGFTETLASSVEIPPAAAGQKPRRGGGTVEPDGFWFVDSDQRDCVVVSEQYPCRRMKDDVSITLRTDKGFAVAVRKPPDDPVLIDWSEPEAADVFILKTGGEVVHLRPHGTMPAAAIARFGGEVAPPQASPGDAEFPYPLPRVEGERVWVSVHAGGKRRVAAFDLAAENP